MFNRFWQTFFHTSVFWQWNRKNLSMDLLCRAFYNRMKPVPSWWIWFTQVNVPCRRTSRPHVMFETSTFLHPHHLRITLQLAPLLQEGFYFCLLIILLKLITLVFISISLPESTDHDQNRLFYYRHVCDNEYEEFGLCRFFDCRTYCLHTGHRRRLCNKSLK